jgi:thymidylate kinase
MGTRISKETFLARAKARFGDRYDYTGILYKSYRTPVKIRCHQHPVAQIVITPERHRGLPLLPQGAGALATAPSETSTMPKSSHKKNKEDLYEPSNLLEDLAANDDKHPTKLERKIYEKELAKLHIELVKMQYWVKQVGYRLIIVFEGRDAAVKGGTIKRITEPLNPRGCQVIALGTPSDHQKTQWYFQRYVEHFPSAGEIIIFDRSW